MDACSAGLQACRERREHASGSPTIRRLALSRLHLRRRIRRHRRGAGAARPPTRSSSTATSSPSTRGSRSRRRSRSPAGGSPPSAPTPQSGSWPARRRRPIDLRGQTVIPGLADNHLHDAGGGPGVDLSRVRTMDALLAAIAARVKQVRPGDVVTTNSDWHEAQLEEHRLPYRRDLDTVSPVNPVVVVRGGHEYILNSAALTKWKITKETPQLPGGRITRDAQGELNGELVDRAKSLVQLPPPPPLTDRGAGRTAPQAERRGPDEHPLPGRVDRAVPAASGDAEARPADDPRQSADARRRRQRREDARGGRGAPASSPTKATSGCASAA